jgi:GTP cyclohydrolase I
MTFPYFVMKKAPVTGVESLMNYQATIFGEHRDGKTDVWLKVVVPTTSLCPARRRSPTTARTISARTSP